MRATSLLVAVFTVTGALFAAGCLGPPQDPVLELLGEGDCPKQVGFRVTNAGDVSMEIRASGFRVEDAAGTPALLDQAATESMGLAGFPPTAALAPGESAEGELAFDSGTGNGPYALAYEFGEQSARVTLNDPPQGTDGCGAEGAQTVELAASVWVDFVTEVRVVNVTAAPVNVSWLTYQVVAPNKTTYFDGPAGRGQAVNGVTVTVAFVDLQDDRLLGVNDWINVSVGSMAQRLKVGGATLKLLLNGSLLAEVVLPPGPPSAFTLSAGPWSGNETVISITGVDRDDRPPSALEFRLEAANHTDYFAGAAGTGLPVHGITVTIAYHDTTGDGLVGTDDTITVSVSPAVGLQQVNGTTLSLREAGVVLTEVVLPGAPTPWFSLSASTWSASTITFAVVSSHGPPVDVRSISYRVWAENGTTYFNGSAGTGGPVNGVTITVSFGDASPVGTFDPSVSIELSVSPSDGVYQVGGWWFGLVWDGILVGTVRVPDGPTPSLGVGPVDSLWHGATTYLEVKWVQPSTLSIDGLTFRVIDAGGTVYFDGAPGIDNSVNGTTITVTYSDSGAQGSISTDDTIAITVDPPGAIPLVAGAGYQVLLDGVLKSSGTLPDAPIQSISLSAGQWSGTNTVISITSVSGAPMPVSALIFQVVAANGTIYFHGSAGTGVMVNGVTVTVTYNDASGDGWVGADDNIAVSVGSAAELTQIHGTQFKVLESGYVLGTAGLP